MTVPSTTRRVVILKENYRDRAPTYPIPSLIDKLMSLAFLDRAKFKSEIY